MNLDFDDAYEKAVEAKVVAIQRAAEAKNETVQIEEQAKQTVKTAQAEAEAGRPPGFGGAACRWVSL